MASIGGSIGSAYVDVQADLSRLQSQFRDAISEAGRQGKALGDAASSGMAQAGGAQGYFDNLKASFVNFKNTVAGISDETFGRWRRNLDDFGSSLQGLGTSLTVGVTLPLAGLATAAISAFGDLDSLKRGLIATAGSADEAERQFSELREVARLPGLGLEEAVRGSINLQNFGFAAGESKEILLQFGNALATVGKGRVELDRVILQLGQMAGAGKVLMQDLRPIITQVPQMAGVLRNLFGSIDPGEINAKLEAAGLSTRDFVAMVTAELAKLPRVTGGLKNDLENFADTVKIALADLGGAMAPIFSQILNIAVPVIQGLTAAFLALPQPVQTVAIVLGGLAALAGPTLIFFGSLSRGLSDLIGLFVQLRGAAAVAGELQAATTAINGVGTAASTGGTSVGLLSSALRAIGPAAAIASAALIGISIGSYVADVQIAHERTERFTLGLASLGPNGMAQFKQALAEGGQALEQFRAHMENVGRNLGQSIGGASGETRKLAADIRELTAEMQKASIPDLENKLKLIDFHMSQGSKTTEQYRKELLGMVEAWGKEILVAENAATATNTTADAVTQATPPVKEHAVAVGQVATAAQSVATHTPAASKGIGDIGNAARQQIDSVKGLADALVNLAQQAKATLLDAYSNPSNMPGLTGTVRDLMDAVGETTIKIGNMTATLENGVVVMRGAGSAAREAADAKRDLGSAARDAASGYDNLASSAREAAAAVSQMGRGIGPSRPGGGPDLNAGEGLPSDAMTYMQSLIGVGAIKDGPELGMFTQFMELMGYRATGRRQFETEGAVANRMDFQSAVQDYEALRQQIRGLGGDIRNLPVISGSGSQINWLQLDQAMTAAERMLDILSTAAKESADAAKKAAVAERELKDARSADTRTVKQLTDDLWRLIDAGHGSSMAAFDLRNRIAQLAQDTGGFAAAAQTASRAVRASLGEFTVSAMTAAQGIAAAAQYIKREAGASFIGQSQVTIPGLPATSSAPLGGSGGPGSSSLASPYRLVVSPVYLDGVQVGEVFTNVLRTQTGIS